MGGVDGLPALGHSRSEGGPSAKNEAAADGGGGGLADQAGGGRGGLEQQGSEEEAELQERGGHGDVAGCFLPGIDGEWDGSGERRREGMGKGLAEVAPEEEGGAGGEVDDAAGEQCSVEAGEGIEE